MNKSIVSAAAGLLILSSFACSTPPHEPSDIEGALQVLVDQAVASTDAVQGAALFVDAPQIGLLWEGAAGRADPGTGEPMTVLHPVRVASNTKTYIAAAILRLWEEGRLGLDEPITQYLSDESIAVLDGDGYDLEMITPRHLLTHTSGVYDYSHDDRFTEAILDDPQHRWTRAEQLEAAVQWGQPLGSPGEVFWYADTGYILLGEILEQVMGESMPAAVWQLIGADDIGLGSSWFESLEPQPKGVPERAHQFYGDVDTAKFDPSFDLYGGGGIAATVGDLGRFYGALFRGGLFREPETLTTMLTTVDGAQVPDGLTSFLAPGSYRMGIWEADVHGMQTWRHSGFFGTIATYVPRLDLVVAATVNQNQGRQAMEDLVAGAIATVDEAIN